jgi:hypothetical protein
VSIPPTVRDTPKRRWGLILGALLLLLAFGAGGYLYFAVWKRPPRAHLHVPKGSNIALRADGMKIATFKPVRQHLWPVLLKTRGDGAEESERMKRIKQHTGIAVPLDFREVIIASLDATSWVAVVGGTFPAGRFVPGMQKVFEEEKVAGWTLDQELLVHSLGFCLGQADDGTLVFGTTVDVARAALPEGDEQPALPLPVDGALSFSLNEQAWSGAVSTMPLNLPGIESLSKIDSVSGNFTLSEQPRLALVVDPKDGTNTTVLAKEIEGLLGKLKLAALLTSGDMFGGRQALREAKVAANGAQVNVDAPWPYDKLDQAVAVLAKSVEMGHKLGGGS